MTVKKKNMNLIILSKVLYLNVYNVDFIDNFKNKQNDNNA